MDRVEARMYGFVVLAAVWAPALLTLVIFMLLSKLFIIYMMFHSGFNDDNVFSSSEINLALGFLQKM